MQNALLNLSKSFEKAAYNTELQEIQLNNIIVELLSVVMSYNQTGQASKIEEIHTDISKLTKAINGSTLSKTTIQDLDAFINNIKLIIVKRPIINTILSKIDNLQVQRHLNASIVSIQINNSQQIEAQKEYTNYLTYYALALLLLFIFIAIRLLYSFFHLNTLNKNLETEVANRTQDLQIALDELKKSEMILIQSEKMSALGQLVAGVAHEINTPLAYTKNALSLIQSNIKDFNFKNFIELAEAFIEYTNMPSGPDKQKQQEVIQRRYQIMQLTLKKLGIDNFRYYDLLEETSSLLADGITGTERISELIVNLRNFSRLDRGDVSKYSLKEAIHSTLVLLRYEIKNKDITINAKEDLEVECMPSQINQVLLNILANANHAIGKDGKITITLYKDEDDYACISIKDDGSGISKENLRNIFNPFFTTKSAGKGTGLGLSISYKIIHDHSGDIVVNSIVGEGSEFIVKLPFDTKLSTIFF